MDSVNRNASLGEDDSVSDCNIDNVIPIEDDSVSHCKIDNTISVEDDPVFHCKIENVIPLPDHVAHSESQQDNTLEHVQLSVNKGHYHANGNTGYGDNKTRNGEINGKRLPDELHIRNGSGTFANGELKTVSIDVMIPIVGGYGCFQKIVQLLLCIMAVPAGFQLVIAYFITARSPWKCAHNSTKCYFNGTFPDDDDRRCAFPRKEWVYTMPKEYSTQTEFDLYCNDAWLVSFATMIFFIGWMIGAIFVGWIADNYGRKTALFISMTMVLVFTFIGAFMVHIYLLIICRFIVGFFAPGTFPQIFILISEIVDDKHRPFAGIMVFIFTAAGAGVLCLKAYFIRQWKNIYIVCSAPYIVVLLFFIFIPESVRYLRVKGKINEVMATFNRIAYWNKKVIPEGLTISSPPIHVTSRHANPCDLFRTMALAKKTIIQGYVWFSCGVAYVGLYLASADLDGGRYRDFILVCVAEIPGIIAIIDLVERWGRKVVIVGSMFIGSITCFALMFIPTEGNFKIMRIVFGMFGKCFLTASFDGLHTWSIELYPANIRGEAMGFMQVVARIGTASSPWVATELKKVHKSAPFIFIGGVSFIAFLAMLLLPETKGVKTCDTDRELENKVGNKPDVTSTEMSVP